MFSVLMQIALSFIIIYFIAEIIYYIFIYCIINVNSYFYFVDIYKTTWQTSRILTSKLAIQVHL